MSAIDIEYKELKDKGFDQVVPLGAIFDLNLVRGTSVVWDPS